MAQFQAVKEILLAGDANRLVAELTFVRINDLAAPPDEVDILAYLEPFVLITILANGIMIGIQSDPDYADWPGWQFFEIGFAAVLLFECCIRYYMSGCQKYCKGAERWWNRLDIIFLIMAIVDLLLESLGEENSTMFIALLLRFARLVRLTRIMKVFRLHWMKELRLMLKGLVGGFRTLVTAFLLLFSVLYVIAGLATYTLGRDERIIVMGYYDLFYNLPASMFTTFRCLSGQCESDEGAPLASVLFKEFGLPFVLAYILSYMLVSMGIFNVILAVYVDITMRAAKENEATTAEQHSRESVRVARTARELLKKFAAAHKLFRGQDLDDMSNAGTAIDLTPASGYFTDQAM
ncbi:unnamed protein product, partial [Effrenium voratum]